MSDDYTGMFYNIGDGSGSGDDHCELVGGSESTAIESPDYSSSPDIQGIHLLRTASFKKLNVDI